MTSNKTNNRAS